ncbi:ATP synthase epsilon chain [Candidatus Phycosocius bacilliformis]|uniref:ATP synthase epsilon chain n=1 Tax=Candidatus Phycosocius bacilliformis TaxID=1445552 RepID=A0A2P2E618_9PROT|nr:F0F1 ATP synthase subunit epsilon [Candidatus Phycosocius bacilliformis]GBF56492.1 ATP synthase epsilon chain [Candidatus Phycosocius bacilliformis]
MATSGKLHFSLVSPERALFSGDVDQVVVPGVEGQFGVLSQHAPFMTVVQQGAIRILDGSAERRIFVGGGFADVTPDGLTILAEDAVDLSQLDTAGLERDVQNAREDVRDAKDSEAKAAAERKLARLEAIRAAA